MKRSEGRGRREGQREGSVEGGEGIVRFSVRVFDRSALLKVGGKRGLVTMACDRFLCSFGMFWHGSYCISILHSWLKDHYGCQPTANERSGVNSVTPCDDPLGLCTSALLGTEPMKPGNLGLIGDRVLEGR